MSDITAEPLSKVRPETIRWLWKPFLPLGKLVVLDGDPGPGKSLLTIDIAARLSRGGYLPDGTESERPHVTLLLSAEDDAADTTRPRADAAGADLNQLIAVTPAEHTPLQFPADFGVLTKLVAEHRPSLVVIDPITAFLPGDVVANSDQSVRRVLSRLALIAERAKCAIVLVRHLRKAGGSKAVYRGAGSIGIIAASRTGLLVAPHPTEKGVRVLAVTKSNVSCPMPSLGYKVRDRDGVAVIDWTGPTVFDADALDRGGLRPRDRVTEWLRGELANGPRKSAEVYAAATAAGIPERTLQRAKADLRVASRVVITDGVREWVWSLPADAGLADGLHDLPELPPLE